MKERMKERKRQTDWLTGRRTQKCISIIFFLFVNLKKRIESASQEEEKEEKEGVAEGGGGSSSRGKQIAMLAGCQWWWLIIVRSEHTWEEERSPWRVKGYYSSAGSCNSLDSLVRVKYLPGKKPIKIHCYIQLLPEIQLYNSGPSMYKQSIHPALAS